MKNNKKRYIPFLILLLIFGACDNEDFLDRIPQDTPSPDNFFVDAVSARASVNGIYRSWTSNSQMLNRDMIILLDAMTDDYIRTALAKGLRDRTVIIRHALRNALIPAVTVMGLQFGGLISGAVITETIFARVGLGRMYVESILNKDITMIQGLTLVLALMIMLINIIVDLSYAV